MSRLWQEKRVVFEGTLVLGQYHHEYALLRDPRGAEAGYHPANLDSLLGMERFRLGDRVRLTIETLPEAPKEPEEDTDG
jgi:hypothetical protein